MSQFGMSTELTVVGIRFHDADAGLMIVRARGKGLYLPIEFELSSILRISVGDKLKLDISGSTGDES
jgi:hypothetical protein